MHCLSQYKCAHENFQTLEKGEATGQNQFKIMEKHK